LLLPPGGEVEFWDDRWQALTGLSQADLAGVRCEVVLDWLFPHQPDRDRVADLMNHPVRRSTCSALQVLSPEGSRPLQCTFTPLVRNRQECWLLLTAAPETAPGGENPAMAYLRPFALGLGRLLNHLVAGPLGLAELALERNDLSADTARILEQLQANFLGLVDLITLLQDLGASTAGDLEIASLAQLVQEFLDEHTVIAGEPSYELCADLQAPSPPVRVNRRMIKTVLGHLLTGAEQLLASAGPQRIEVRVYARIDGVCCEIEDASVHPPGEEPGRTPRESRAQGAMRQGTGLGPIVCQHLLALHGGRLEMHGQPGEGILAAIVLPRWEAASHEPAPASSAAPRVHADASTPPAEPHS
jgi:signal transduction histidine kinase